MRYYYTEDQPTGLLTLVVLGFFLGMYMNPIATLFVVFLIALYLLPGIIAILRLHPSLVAIFLLNLFLGWTVIVWIAVLVWSLWRQKAHDHMPAPMPALPVQGFEMPARTKGNEVQS